MIAECKTYGLDAYLRYHADDGSYTLRDVDFAQPKTLEVGDVLANGWRIKAEPFTAFNGAIGLMFIDGIIRIVPPSVALQLESGRAGVLPKALKIGTILQTGCVVLETPSEVKRVPQRGNQNEVQIRISGGHHGQQLGVPADVPLAISPDAYPPAADTFFGSYVLQKVQAMSEYGQRNLLEMAR